MLEGCLSQAPYETENDRRTKDIPAGDLDRTDRQSYQLSMWRRAWVPGDGLNMHNNCNVTTLNFAWMMLFYFVSAWIFLSVQKL